MSTTFEINGINYRANPMDARRQFHVTRRLARVMSAFMPIMAATQAAQDGEKAAAAMDALSEVLNALVDGLADLSDADADYVINSCLAVTEREIDGKAGWAPIMANGVITFEDIRTSMAAMLQILYPVLKENIQTFLSEFPKDKLQGLVAKA